MSRPERKLVSLAISQLGKLRISQEQIAGELKVSFQTVYRWAKKRVHLVGRITMRCLLYYIKQKEGVNKWINT